MTVTDGSVQLARRRLEDGVAALCDPFPARIGGAYRWRRALYVQLRVELSGGSPLIRRGAAWGRTRTPLRMDVLRWLIDVDDTVAGWTANGEKSGTVERLHALAVRSFRPQDCPLLDGYCADLARWVLAGQELLTPATKIFLSPCPNCGARVAYRRNDAGERVQTKALKVTEVECRCQACGACWEPDQYHFLARLLGGPALPGVGNGAP